MEEARKLMELVQRKLKALGQAWRLWLCLFSAFPFSLGRVLWFGFVCVVLDYDGYDA
jgi:hypothetical protein